MFKIIKNVPLPDISSSEKCRGMIKELLSRNNINVSELSRKINLPQPTIHRLLTGKTEDPKLSTLALIANYFSISIDQLLGQSPLKPNIPHTITAAHFIPQISWQDTIRYDKTTTLKESTNQLLVDPRISFGSFCLKTKKSMEPRFSTGTLLIVDPNIEPTDGDLVIAAYPNTTEATIREIVLDGPKRVLLSILDGKTTDGLTKDIKLIGVIIEARISYKQLQINC